MGDYTILGSTLDDSIGEALDKATRMLNLPLLPGESPAASLEKAALQAKRGEVGALPLPMKGDPSLDFSFSGLKTALRYKLEKISGAVPVNEFAFEFQRAATGHLEDRLERALNVVQDIKQVVVSGGVAKNQYIRARLSSIIKSHGNECHFAPIELCSDNAAMIGWAAIENINAGFNSVPPETHLEVLPVWPLDQLKYNR